MFFSSGNTFIDTSRDNVLPATWALLSLVRLTYKINFLSWLLAVCTTSNFHVFLTCFALPFSVLLCIAGHWPWRLRFPCFLIIWLLIEWPIGDNDRGLENEGEGNIRLFAPFLCVLTVPPSSGCIYPAPVDQPEEAQMPVALSTRNIGSFLHSCGLGWWQLPVAANCCLLHHFLVIFPVCAN